MPHIVELELALEDGSPAAAEGAGTAPVHAAVPQSLKLRREDFRVHGGGQPHWLLVHPFGQELLITKLQKERPDMKVPRYRMTPELVPLLDSMIDVLGMRAWPQPKGARARVQSWVFLLKCQVMLANDRTLPDWHTLGELT